MIPPEEIDQVRREKDPFFLDIRRESEIRELGTLEGYTHIPLDELPDRLDELPRARQILTA